MNVEIFKTNIDNQIINSINARDLWKALESKQDFSTWIKNRIEKLRLKENRDFCSFHNLVEQVNKGNAGGQNKIEYLLTLDIAKHFAMIEQTQKGYEVREFFIECEKQLSKPKELSKIEILEIALKTEKENVELKNKIKQDTPLVNLATQITQSDGSLSIGDFAKVLCKKGLNIGQKRLFEFLRQEGFLNNKNIPYQRFIQNGYFELIEKCIPNLINKELYTQTLITGKGQSAILEKLLIKQRKGNSDLLKQRCTKITTKDTQ